jgi:broad specificity phosphatase PhoE
MFTQMVKNWEDGYEQVSILDGESLLDVNERLLPFFTRIQEDTNSELPILLIGHAITWMAFIWKNCINKPANIKDGFMSIANYSILEAIGNGFYSRELNIQPY